MERPYHYLVKLGSAIDAIRSRSLPREGSAEVRVPLTTGGFYRKRYFVPLSPGAGRDIYLHHIREPFSSVTYASTLSILSSEGFRVSVLDIGSNFGYYAAMAERYAHEVHAFEPQALLLKYLRTNCSICFIYRAAVWTETGTVRFDVPDRHNFGRVSDEGSLEVPAISVADLPSLSGDTVVLRMDIEGGETEILRPLVRRYRPGYIFVELHPNIVGEREISRLLDFLGDYAFIAYYEPLPETIGLPLSRLVWRTADIGVPRFNNQVYSMLSRGWVVHLHAYKLVTPLYYFFFERAPWSVAYRAI